MHLVIISGAARPQSKSNTAKIIEAFRRGYTAEGNTSEVWYLSDRRQWDNAKEAFEHSDNILLALPLYVENISGTLLEFLEQLTPKSAAGTRIAFLLQGGFPEASQSRCCEKYLETVPAQLGCTYAGALIKGDMFGIGLMGSGMREKLLAPFTQMGRYFAQKQRFEKEAVDKFAAPEYMSEKQIRSFERFGRRFQRIYLRHIAKKLGCRRPLDAAPYSAFVR